MALEDGRRGRDQRRLADALGAEGTDGSAILDEDGLDLRHVAEGRDQIVVQILGPAGDVLLHQRQPQPLGDAAVDLAFDHCRIDGTADIMRGDDRAPSRCRVPRSTSTSAICAAKP